MSIKGIVIVVLLGVLVWTNRDQIPTEYQFWKKAETVIVVRNNADRDINDVVVVVWSKEHPLGTIPKGQAREIKAFREGDATEVVLKLRYGSEGIERHVARLTSETGYRLVLAVNFAGVITVQLGQDGQQPGR